MIIYRYCVCGRDKLRRTVEWRRRQCVIDRGSERVVGNRRTSRNGEQEYKIIKLHQYMFVILIYCPQF